jgi:hypothetical protein
VKIELAQGFDAVRTPVASGQPVANQNAPSAIADADETKAHAAVRVEQTKLREHGGCSCNGDCLCEISSGQCFHDLSQAEFGGYCYFRIVTPVGEIEMNFQRLRSAGFLEFWGV